jgi:hypothetical protein
MKRLKIFVVTLFLNVATYGQIHPYLGIYDDDSCKFNTACSLINFTDKSHNMWQTGRPLKPFFGTAYSEPFALMTDSINPYPKSIHTYFDLILPEWIPNVIVSFKHKYQTDSLKDGGYIEVSYDSGKTWNNVIDDKKVHFSIYFGMEKMYAQNDTLIQGHKGFSGTSNGWIYSRIQWVWLVPLSNIPPNPLYMRFHFISDSIDNEKAGWVIDDILISHAFTGWSVKKTGEDTKLKYSPNPMTTETVFYFDNPIKEKYSLRLYNSKGQLVKTQSEYHPQSITLKRGNLNSGLYYFMLKSESGIESKGKLIIE